MVYRILLFLHTYSRDPGFLNFLNLCWYGGYYKLGSALWNNIPLLIDFAFGVDPGEQRRLSVL